MTKRLIVLPAHPDDEILTMWPYIHYLASGYDTHIVFLTRGEVTAASLRLDPDPSHYSGGVQPVCQWTDHAYKHNPTQELYPLPTVEEIGLARLHEGMSAAGAMAMIPPTNPAEPGYIFTHDENLGTAYGCSGCGSSVAPPTAGGIAAADEVIRRYIEEYPNSIFWTHSPTDAHPDHAAAGIALRNLKGTPHLATSDPLYIPPDPTYGPALVNARFFVSKLYWSTPTGQVGCRLGEPCAWYPNNYPDNTAVLARRAEYTAWIKTKVLKAYTCWDPVSGSFAIGGGHSTPSQFANCFAPPPPYVASALWHA